MTSPIGIAGNEDWLIALAKRCEIDGQREQAKRLADAVLDHAPDHPEALNLKGVIVLRELDPDRAVQFFARAVEVAPEIGMFQRNLGEAYRIICEPEKAVRHAERAVELMPDDAEAHYLLSVARYFTLDMKGAEAAVRRALTLNPDHFFAHFHLATILLVQGDLPSGFTEYEWRWRHPNAPPMIVNQRIPRWAGEPGQALLLVCDQGFGDVIQFLRYLPEVLDRCPATRLTGPPEMASVVDLFPPARGLFIALEEVESFDCFCPVSSLPLVIGTTLETIPAAAPYIEADPAKVDIWRAKLDRELSAGTKRVGIVWAGRPEHANDRNRSIPLDAFELIAMLDGVSLISLQKGPAANQLASFAARDRILDLGGELVDFADTAALISCLDLVITVDTATVHLAGALGADTRLLLPFAPEWRWLLDRPDTPWYPTVKLMRQPAPRDWDQVLRDLVIELALID
jgi:hypothetical protein